jgi:hypothetical protein
VPQMTPTDFLVPTFCTPYTVQGRYPPDDPRTGEPSGVFLTPFNSRFAHDLARKPKRLVVYPGAGHSLDEVADELHALVGDWLRTWLKATR